MTECKEREAIKELLSEDEPAGYIETLDEMFEAWLSSELTNGTTGNMRMTAYLHVKALKRLMNSIK